MPPTGAARAGRGPGVRRVRRKKPEVPAMSSDAEVFPLVDHCKCFGCNPTHPKGLRMTFFAAGPDRVRSRLTVSDDYVGLGSVVHGGIIATVFDDVMMWCLLRFRRKFFFTVTMEQAFRRPTLAGTALIAEAVIGEELPNRRVRVSARLVTEADPDTELASGGAVYAEVPPPMLALIPPAQRLELEAILQGFAEHHPHD
jgi:acyl-coenzyme A thioesterase PaaI-like protein